MRTQPKTISRNLGVEQLEARLVPSAVPLLQESFDGTRVGALPSGWSQWSSGGGSFAVSADRSVSAPDSLASTGNSSTSSRAWVASTLVADSQVSASVFVDGLTPTQVIARGTSLNSWTPTYYAISISRGLSAQLIRVVNGVSTTLGSVASASWFQGKWAQLTLSVNGSHIQGQIYRSDTGQYLNASGQWQSAQTWAFDRTDTAITGAGADGVARVATYAGTLYIDNFSITAATSSTTGSSSSSSTSESFDGTAVGSMPSGWSQWSNNGGTSFAVSRSLAEGSANGLASSGTSSQIARTWLNASQSANVQVSAAVFADGLIPAEVLARGSNLATATPTYYALTVRRGLYVQLIAVVNGVSTTLGQISSSTWLEAKWVDLTLSVNGSHLQAQVYRPDTGQYLNSSGQWQTAQAWAIDRTDTRISASGYVGLGREAAYAGNVYFDNFRVSASGGTSSGSTGGTSSGSTGVSTGSTGATAPTIPQHYSWIRLAELAYSGTPLGSYEDQLLRNSVDLVVTDLPALSQHIGQVAPNTPQLAYINYSSLYGSLLTDWDAWADAHGVSRENAFLHVTQRTAFSGDSPSSEPVSWFWGVYQGGLSPDFQDMTSEAYTPGVGDFSLGNTQGQSTYIGYPEVFRQINFNFASSASSGWSAVLEYPTAVDASGNPTAWATMPTSSNSTAGLTRSGQVTFNPPSNWKTASINGSALMYYVRVRVVSSGKAPIVSTILGEDYTGADSGTTGVIPVAGSDPRFAYQSRLFYGSYGQMRFATNPSNPYFRAWAIDYTQRFLAAHPLVDGFFVDNSGGSPLVSQSGVKESISTYTNDYGSLLSAIGRAIAPNWILANTAGGGIASDPVVSQNTAYFEEFALRPLSASWRQFEDTAALVAHRAGLQSPSPYAVLDALPTGGSPTDPRTQIATLAYYYLIGDPTRTFLDLFGGYSPASSWSQHFFNAITYNVGQPVGTWRLFDSGADPNDYRFSYRVYSRTYQNALVLYKPLSSNLNGSATGTTSDNTATVEQLGGRYRALNADGTLGPVITSISLRNGEGAILIKA
jgi:hypothetical protein